MKNYITWARNSTLSCFQHWPNTWKFAHISTRYNSPFPRINLFFIILSLFCDLLVGLNIHYFTCLHWSLLRNLSMKLQSSYQLLLILFTTLQWSHTIKRSRKNKEFHISSFYLNNQKKLEKAQKNLQCFAKFTLHSSQPTFRKFVLQLNELNIYLCFKFCKKWCLRHCEMWRAKDSPVQKQSSSKFLKLHSRLCFKPSLWIETI